MFVNFFSDHDLQVAPDVGTVNPFLQVVALCSKALSRVID